MKKRFNSFKKNYLENISAILLGGLTFICFLQVVSRYFHFIYLVGWAEEFSRLFFVWSVFIGAIVCTKNDNHLSVTLFINLFEPSGVMRKFLSLLRHVLIGIIAGLFFFYGLIFVQRTAADHMTTLGYPKNVFYWPAPVCGLFMLVYIFPKIIKDIKNIITRRNN